MSNLTDDERDLLREAHWHRQTEAAVRRIIDARERAARAEALREAGLAALSDGEGVPFDHDYDRAVVGAWLDERAEREEANQ